MASPFGIVLCNIAGGVRIIRFWPLGNPKSLNGFDRLTLCQSAQDWAAVISSLTAAVFRANR
jgi:hypothetical protein